MTEEAVSVSHTDLYRQLGSMEAKIDAILLRMAEDRGTYKDQLEALHEEHKNLGQRIAHLEKWRWGVVGGASVVAVLLTYTLDIIKVIQ